MAHKGRSSPSLGTAIAEISRRQRALEDYDTGSEGGRGQPSRLLRALAWNDDGSTLDSLHDDIRALAGQVESLRREQATVAPAVCNLDRLRSEISTMSDALRDLGQRGSIAPLEATIRNLTQQIETSRGDGIREAVLQPLERFVADLRLAIADADPRTTIRGLEGEVQKLGSKLAPVERIERQIDALTQRFDQLRDLAQRDNGGRREEGSLDAVADELRMLTSDRGRVSLNRIENQLAAITGKIEEALAEARDETRYTALANRINDVHHELADRMSNGTPQIDVHALEDLVRSLAEKIEAAHGPQADSRAIEALQKQVAEFAARLDRANGGLPSLTSLEHSIKDLFGEFERTRDVSYAAAEKAARSALDQALTKSGGSEPSELAQDLAELRKVQDEAGRRTLATLNAVHETLEKVVDRLAMVETEIADVRGRPAPELLASGPAPNFAPAPSRGPAPQRNEKRDNKREEKRARTAPPPQMPPAQMPPQMRPPQMPAASTEMLDDFLIEPGRGLPRGQAAARDAGNALDMPEPAAGHAGFIAAARRAAQAAQVESAAVLGTPGSRRPVKSETAVGIVEQARNLIAHYKRPVVLSVAALFLVMGAYAVVKTVGRSPILDLSVGGAKEPPAHIAPARLPQNPVRTVPMSAPNAMPKPSAALPSFLSPDPITTGSIGGPPKTPPPAAASGGEVSPAILQKLAQAGNAKAQYELATDYSIGAALPRDLRLAAQWYEKAALQGLAPAQYRLGTLYEKGLGVKRDSAMAMGWYQKAAAQGNVRAMHNLAVLTAEGGDSGKPDYASAARWFRQAAEYGVRDSQYNVAILLARGLGVPQNLTLSYVWFSIAAAQGDDDAGHKRDDVGARLSPADLAAAQATAAAFHAKTPEPAANEVTPPPGGWSAPAASSFEPQGKPPRVHSRFSQL